LIRWSRRARDDIKAIHDYIAIDSPLNAKKVVLDILKRSRRLDAFPRIGRSVRELEDDDVREVSAHSWRLIFQIRGDDAFVLAIVHRRRDTLGIR
jgi:toxin ParE1/3/4